MHAQVLGASAVAAGHDVAATMAFRLRSERDPSRPADIPDYSLRQLSRRSLVLIGLTVLVTPVAAGDYNRIRSAIEQKLPRSAPGAPDGFDACSWLPSAASASGPFCCSGWSSQSGGPIRQ